MPREWPQSMRRQAGVSLPELFVVIAILALGIVISVPLIATRVHAVKLQAAVSQYVGALRAARVIAVSRATSVTVSIQAGTGEHSYQYQDTNGALRKTALPPGVHFGTGSCPAILFTANGSTAGDCTTVIARSTPGGPDGERYVVHVPLSGIPRVVHESSD
jgi:type II secretory pathway pseudopilin PulG